MSINFKYHAQKTFTPLLENKNAVLKFPIETGIEIDSYTGNTVSINSFLTFDAVLHHAKSTEIDKFFPGIDVVGIKLVGRIVVLESFGGRVATPQTFRNPKTLPIEIGDRSKGTVEFTDGRRGTVTLYLLPSNPYIGNELGTKVGLLFNER